MHSHMPRQPTDVRTDPMFSHTAALSSDGSRRAVSQQPTEEDGVTMDAADLPGFPTDTRGIRGVSVHHLQTVFKERVWRAAEPPWKLVRTADEATVRLEDAAIAVGSFVLSPCMVASSRYQMFIKGTDGIVNCRICKIEKPLGVERYGISTDGHAAKCAEVFATIGELIQRARTHQLEGLPCMCFHDVQSGTITVINRETLTHG